MRISYGVFVVSLRSDLCFTLTLYAIPCNNCPCYTETKLIKININNMIREGNGHALKMTYYLYWILLKSITLFFSAFSQTPSALNHTPLFKKRPSYLDSAQSESFHIITDTLWQKYNSLFRLAVSGGFYQINAWLTGHRVHPSFHKIMDIFHFCGVPSGHLAHNCIVLFDRPPKTQFIIFAITCLQPNTADNFFITFSL